MENSSSLKKCLVSMPGLSPLGAAAFAGDEARRFRKPMPLGYFCGCPKQGDQDVALWVKNRKTPNGLLWQMETWTKSAVPWCFNVDPHPCCTCWFNVNLLIRVRLVGELSFGGLCNENLFGSPLPLKAAQNPQGVPNKPFLLTTLLKCFFLIPFHLSSCGWTKSCTT